jgi:hypothetical protein
LSDFEREQIVGALLAGASVIKNGQIIRYIKNNSFQGYFGMHESWEDNSISKEERWLKINIYRKRLSYIGKDCFEKSQNYCSTGALQQN